MSLFKKRGELLQSIEGMVDKLEPTLLATSSQEFEEQLRRSFSSDKARHALSVVYTLSARDPINRLNGASNIVYIGKTKGSLFSRYNRYAHHLATGDNWRRYDHIFRNYGPITFFFVTVPNPDEIEKVLVGKYRNDHLEFPPLNRRD